MFIVEIIRQSVQITLLVFLIMIVIDFIGFTQTFKCEFCRETRLLKELLQKLFSQHFVAQTSSLQTRQND